LVEEGFFILAEDWTAIPLGDIDILQGIIYGCPSSGFNRLVIGSPSHAGPIESTGGVLDGPGIHPLVVHGVNFILHIPDYPGET
jgi:hypothetical protein